MSDELKLSRRISARTETLVASWCRKDFMEMSQEFRAIRAKSKNPMDKCFWCKHKFKDGEMMALACFGGKGNKTLCQECAGKLLSIEEATWNPIAGCSSVLSIPLKKKKPTTWFVNSMSDLFHEDVPFEFIAKVFAVMALCPQHTFQILTKRAERMAEFFGCLLLPSHWEHSLSCHAAMLTAGERDIADFQWPLPNVWLGVSCEDQQRADAD